MLLHTLISRFPSCCCVLLLGLPVVWYDLHGSHNQHLRLLSCFLPHHYVGQRHSEVLEIHDESVNRSQRVSHITEAASLGTGSANIHLHPRTFHLHRIFWTDIPSFSEPQKSHNAKFERRDFRWVLHQRLVICRSFRAGMGIQTGIFLEDCRCIF